MDELILAIAQSLRNLGKDASAVPGGVVCEGCRFSVERFNKFANVGGDMISRVTPRGAWNVMAAVMAVLKQLPMRLKRMAEVKLAAERAAEVASYAGMRSARMRGEVEVAPGVTLMGHKDGYTVSVTVEHFDLVELLIAVARDARRDAEGGEKLYVAWRANGQKALVRAESRAAAEAKTGWGDGCVRLQQASVDALIALLPEVTKIER